MVALIKTGTVMTIPPLDRSYSESREYRTTNFASDDGSEQRESLLVSGDPRRSVNMRVKAAEVQEQAFMQNIYGHSLENATTVPLWFSLSNLTAAPAGAVLTCATIDREFRDLGKLIIMKPDLSDYEELTIQTVGSGSITLTTTPTGPWVSGDIVLPVIDVIPKENAQIDYRHPWSGVMRMEYMEKDPVLDPEDPAFGSLDSYLSSPVWDLVPNGRVRVTIENPYTLSGEPWQKSEAVVSEATNRMLGLDFLQEDASERAAIRTFFDDRVGRENPFWERSRGQDFTLAVAASAGASTILVVDSGEIQGLSDVTRHVFSRTLGNYYKVTNPTQVGDNIQLTVSPVLTGDLAIGSIFENLFFVRFNHDLLTVSASNRGLEVSTSSVTLKELQKETP